MTENPYRTVGPSIPPMLGRASLVRQIERHLLKPSPDHVSVVGPAHYGKSVLLRHLADSHRRESEVFLTTVHIDLRYHTPTSDAAFKRRFAEEIKAALRAERPQIAEYLEFEEEAIHESLDLVFTDLDGEGKRLLVVLDGFDKVLRDGELTRNLWDQLRSLAQKSSLRLVTGSRRPLRELCRTEESRTSDFWEIFYDTPIRVGALEDDSDWESFLQPLLDAGGVVDEPARKEIVNWTGGVPWLVCALLRRLWEQGPETARLSKPEIDQAAEAVLEEQRELLAELWDDCDMELRADLGAIATGETPAKLSDRRRRALESRGFGRVSKNRLRGSCRLMQHYAAQQAPALSGLKHLFGTALGFETHIRSLLELRLAQVAGPEVDRDLCGFVRSAVRDIEPEPAHALIWVRSIADRALALVWKAEGLPRDRTLPLHWRNAGVTGLPDNEDKLPDGSGPQCGVLRQITGTGQIRRQSRCVTKTTCLLIDHLQSVGSFAQHREGTDISIGFAAVSVLAAISLIESLTADLHRQEGTGRDTT